MSTPQPFKIINTDREGNDDQPQYGHLALAKVDQGPRWGGEEVWMTILTTQPSTAGG